MNLQLTRRLPPAMVWQTRRWLAAYAQPVKAGALGLAAALALWVLAIRPESKLLEQDTAALARHSTGQTVANAADADPIGAAEREFIEYFRSYRLDSGSAPMFLRDMSNAAAGKQVRIESVSQSPRELRDLSLAGVEFNTSLTGTYPAVRSLVGDMMQRYPHLGVESLNLSKESAGGRLKAEIKWVLVAPTARPSSI